MLQKQMLVSASHSPSHPSQVEDGRPSATYTLEVREQGWVGPELRAGDRFREGWGHCRLQRRGAPRLGQPLPSTRGHSLAQLGLGSWVDGPAADTHGLDKTLRSGSGTSWAQQHPGGQCSALLGVGHIWPLLTVSRHLPCGCLELPAGRVCGVVSGEDLCHCQPVSIGHEAPLLGLWSRLLGLCSPSRPCRDTPGSWVRFPGL